MILMTIHLFEFLFKLLICIDVLDYFLSNIGCSKNLPYMKKVFFT